MTSPTYIPLGNTPPNPLVIIFVPFLVFKLLSIPVIIKAFFFLSNPFNIAYLSFPFIFIDTLTLKLTSSDVSNLTSDE